MVGTQPSITFISLPSLQLQLPACSISLQMAIYVLGSPPPVGCKGLWGKVGARWRELGSKVEQTGEQAGANWGVSWSELEQTGERAGES